MSWKQFRSQIVPIQNKLFRFAVRIVGNPAEAEDIIQEVMIKLWRQSDDLQHITNIEAWCLRVTKNLSIDKIRSKHRRSNGLPEGMDLKDNTADPYDQTASKDTFNQVAKLMEQLPDQQRMVMQLRDIEGMTYQEISDALEMSMAQVKSNLFRARQKIRTKLKMTQSYGL